MTDKLLPAMAAAALALAGGVAGLSIVTAPAPAAAQTGQSAPRDDAAAACSRLAGRTVAGAAIDKADYFAAGAKLAPFAEPLTAGFCRIDASIAPVAGSRIGMQIELPTAWNGKLLGLGGSGFNGGLGNAALEAKGMALQGYAVVATDAGHDDSPQPDWAIGHPEKIVDFGYRANHLGAVVAKALVSAFYGSAPKRSYFHGCSNGGRDALILAQRYPDDYDAIAAGAPANDFTGLMAAMMRNEQVTRAAPGIDTLAPKMKLVNDAVLKKCDALDGVKDGLIERPTACRFDPADLQCRSGDGPACLSKAEVAAVRAVYRGTYLGNGRLVMPGFAVGSEYQWAAGITGVNGAGPLLGRMFYRYLIHADPSWDVARFDLDRDYPLSRRKLGATIDAVDPDIGPFIRRGGKLLLYHGWDDTAIPPGNSLRYYNAVERRLGRRANDAVRLFMLPGVSHCMTGRGPDAVDYVGALDRWSQSGAAPERLRATKYDNPFRVLAGLPAKERKTRPLCAWPKAARYRGTGSPDDEANYVCA